MISRNSKTMERAVNGSLALCGMIVWIVVALITEKNEPWDSDLFWSYGLTAMLLINAVAAFVDPTLPIVKGMLSVSLQPVAMIFMSGEVGSMLPLGLIVFAVLGIFYSVGGVIGSFIKKTFFHGQSFGDL